ncbi:helix-turn-helix domain-containing protein [Micromonospora inyonensis]|uniref:Transcriptional regulator, contains XRE-family HTH domain n=1 Tax=Micromonospora inyonensis TaxID=47866 RepID=A0A1C6SVG1_9ACTN|nr:helix-turn-helix domain-containing protein [Micromonospora inyonensis]SCL15004.1 Transcriptional regulator, contains XRE-family HTH domain [Micromonospora inyonensis]SCL33435.1 Transcriptional regulator, contains XRE-family HTH domain [Micromonospora inyonensis]SCL33521.1 Transcriptional regulator, contains XRE-family HTH domain [Micromonospora inyonensis]
MDVDELPIGRRVAQWRMRRKMSQQVFADRLGKSKSWVDKVERGVRSLDKVSTIQDIAAVLRIDTAVLLGRDAQPDSATERVDAVDRIRAALSTYEVALARPGAPLAVVPAGELAGRVEHAWITYQRARYPQLIALLPDLLGTAQRTHAHGPVSGRAPLVEAYRITASLLVKLGEADLAWLAADRAMAVATGDPVLVATAAVQLGHALRAAGRGRAAMSAVLAAAYRIAPPVIEYGTPPELSLCGTLLVQAALAAARDGDDCTTVELIDEAADMAARVGDGHDHHRTAFGPTAVDLARVTAAIELGERDAVAWHEKATTQYGWQCLPVEHRAGHLVDAARAYLQADDPAAAGRALVDAGRLAPAEMDRPAARDVLARVVRCPDVPPTVTRLATTLGVA